MQQTNRPRFKTRLALSGVRSHGREHSAEQEVLFHRSNWSAEFGYEASVRSHFQTHRYCRRKGMRLRCFEDRLDFGVWIDHNAKLFNT